MGCARRMPMTCSARRGSCMPSSGLEDFHRHLTRADRWSSSARYALQTTCIRVFLHRDHCGSTGYSAGSSPATVPVSVAQMTARDAVPLDLRGPPVAAISVPNASSWPRAIRLVDKTGKLTDLDQLVFTASTASRSSPRLDMLIPGEGK